MLHRPLSNGQQVPLTPLYPTEQPKITLKSSKGIRKGVIALRDLEASEYIGFFEGYLCEKSAITDLERAYLFDCSLISQARIIGFHNPRSQVGIAQHIRDIGVICIQENELTKCENIAEQVRTLLSALIIYAQNSPRANVVNGLELSKYAQVSSAPAKIVSALLAFYALKRIRKNEELLCFYGIEYWLHRLKEEQIHNGMVLRAIYYAEMLYEYSRDKVAVYALSHDMLHHLNEHPIQSVYSSYWISLTACKLAREILSSVSTLPNLKPEDFLEIHKTGKKIVMESETINIDEELLTQMASMRAKFMRSCQ